MSGLSKEKLEHYLKKGYVKCVANDCMNYGLFSRGHCRDCRAKAKQPCKYERCKKKAMEGKSYCSIHRKRMMRIA